MSKSNDNEEKKITFKLENLHSNNNIQAIVTVDTGDKLTRLRRSLSDIGGEKNFLIILDPIVVETNKLRQVSEVDLVNPKEQHVEFFDSLFIRNATTFIKMFNSPFYLSKYEHDAYTKSIIGGYCYPIQNIFIIIKVCFLTGETGRFIMEINKKQYAAVHSVCIMVNDLYQEISCFLYDENKSAIECKISTFLDKSNYPITTSNNLPTIKLDSSNNEIIPVDLKLSSEDIRPIDEEQKTQIVHVAYTDGLTDAALYVQELLDEHKIQLPFDVCQEMRKIVSETVFQFRD